MNAELRVLVEEMLGKSQTNEDFSEKLKKLQEFYPPYLYKYRALNTYAVENVLTSTLWFDSPVNMNDPYDSRYTYSSGFDTPIANIDDFKNFISTSGENIKDNHYLQELLKGNTSIQEIIEKNFPPSISINLKEAFITQHEKGLRLQDSNFLDKIFICSLSERYDSILMWTHYTNNHSGFCVEFDLANIGQLNHFRSCLYPVIYDNNMFDLTDYINTYNRDKEFSNLYIIQTILRKSLDWSYENEWRIVHPFGTLNKSQNLATPKPSSILLGSNFFKSLQSINNSELKEEQIKLALKLIEFCKQQQIPLNLTRHSLQKFLMEREFISYDDANRILLEL